MFVIQITGGRKFLKPAPIKEAIKKYVDQYGAGNIILRQGEAKGADTLSKMIAKSLGIKDIQERPVEFYNLNWDDGLDAGNKRNEAMLDENPIPNIVLAFPDNESRGTWNMIEYAKARNIETIVYYGEISHNNPHYPKPAQTSIEKDVEFGLGQEYSAALLFADSIFPGCQLNKLPEYSDLDFVITKENEVKAFIEVKARRVSVNAYSTTMVAERKHRIAAALYESLKIQTFAIILFTDALVSFHLENKPDDVQFVKRDDRDKGMEHAFYNHSRFTYHIKKDI